MRYLYTWYLTLLFACLASPSLQGQHAAHPLAIGVGSSMLRYTNVEGTPLPYAPALELSFSRYLAGAFDFRTQLTLSDRVLYPNAEASATEQTLVDLNYTLAFKLNNGLILKESAFIGPYALFGVGGSYVPGHPDVYLPLGAGLRFRFNPRLSLRVETMTKYSVNRDDQHLRHAIAFVYNLGQGPLAVEELHPAPGPKGSPAPLASLEAMLPRDTDQDGLPDVQDACPTEAGLIRLQGCPEPAEPKLPSGTLGKPGLVAGPAETTAPTAPSAEPETVARLGDLFPPDLPEAVPGPEEGLQSDLPPAVEAVGQLSQLVPAVPASAGVAESESVEEPRAEGGKTRKNEPEEVPTVAEASVDLPCMAARNKAPEPILFAYGSDQLEETAKTQLAELAAVLASCQEATLLLEGHADATGSDRANLVLSIMRAYNVKYFLVYEYGIAQHRILSKGLGEEKPADSNGTETGRERNRRVNFELVF